MAVESQADSRFYSEPLMKRQSESSCPGEYLPGLGAEASKDLRFSILGALIFLPKRLELSVPRSLCAQFASHLWYPVCPLCNTDWLASCQFYPIVCQSVSTDSAPFSPCKMGIRSCTYKKILSGIRPNLYKISQSKTFFSFYFLISWSSPSETCLWRMACWPRSGGCSEGYTK